MLDLLISCSMPNTKTAGFCYHFNRFCCTIFCNVCANLYFHQQCARVLFFHILINAFENKSNYSNRYDMIFHCIFGCCSPRRSHFLKYTCWLVSCIPFFPPFKEIIGLMTIYFVIDANIFDLD